MSIAVKCTGCGKSLNVKEEFLGKRLKCPACGAKFVATQQMAQTKEKKESRLPSGIHISPSMMVFFALLILIPSTLAFWNFGPGKVRAQWEKLEPKASSEVRDVIDRALQGDTGGGGGFGASIAHASPHTLDLSFPFSPMGFSMPEVLAFAGTTTQGMVQGHYNTKTGEVDAEAELGGLAFPGAGVRRHGDTKIKITGRVKDGNVTAEVDGKKVEVNWGDPARKPVF